MFDMLNHSTIVKTFIKNSYEKEQDWFVVIDYVILFEFVISD